MKSILSNKNVYVLIITFLLSITGILIGSTLAKYVIVEDVGEFNLYIEAKGQAYAVFCEDGSLDFYYGYHPEVGDTLANGKTVEAVYYDNIETSENATPAWNEIASQVKSVSFVDIIMPVSTSGWFSGFTNATSFNLENLDTSRTTNMANMFTNCPSIETLTLGKNFGTSEQTFANVGLNTSITGWTKESENGQTEQTDYLSTNLSLGVAETYTSVTYCYATSGVNSQTLFIYQRKYVPYIGETYNGYKIKSIYSWRNGDKKSSYTTSENCRPPRIDAGNIYNNWSPGTSLTSYVTDILGVSVVDNIKPLTLKNWFKNFLNLGDKDGVINLAKLDTGAATSMSYMFYNCNKPTNLDLTHFHTSNVTDMSYMFSKCFGLKYLDLSSFDTSEVTNMESMFSMETSASSVSEILTIYASDSFVSTKVTNSSNMFYLCSKLKGGNDTTIAKMKDEDPTNYLTAKYAVIDRVGQNGYFTEKPVV